MVYYLLTNAVLQLELWDLDTQVWIILQNWLICTNCCKDVKNACRRQSNKKYTSYQQTNVRGHFPMFHAFQSEF